jgi:hypothetical protein
LERLASGSTSMLGVANAWALGAVGRALAVVAAGLPVSGPLRRASGELFVRAPAQAAAMAEKMRT